MDRVRDVWMSQDWRSEHTKASKSEVTGVKVAAVVIAGRRWWQWQRWVQGWRPRVIDGVESL
jgi:hypothetical protein